MNKIEKLNLVSTQTTDGAVVQSGGIKASYYIAPTALEICRKINELVDAFNELSNDKN